MRPPTLFLIFPGTCRNTRITGGWREMPKCKAQKKFTYEVYFPYVAVFGFFLKRRRWAFPATLLCCILLFPLSAHASDMPVESGSGKAYPPRSLTRVIEPVFVVGEELPPFLGKPINQLRLFSAKDGEFRQIAVQVDERTEKLNWVVTEGPKGNPEDGNGIFDKQDMLSFYIANAGDRTSPESWPAGHTKALELEIIDPIDQGRAWVYLFSFDTPPPPFIHRQIRGEFIFERPPNEKELSAGLKPFSGDTLKDVVLFYDKDGEIAFYIDYGGTHQISYKNASASPAMGGNFEETCDTLRLRMAAQVRGGMFTFRINEGKLRSDTVSYSFGNVVGHRVTENYLPLFGGLRSPKITSDCWAGGTPENGIWIHCPTKIKLPFRLSSVFRSIKVWVGTDFSPEMYGSHSFTSLTPPVIVDGRPSPDELEIKQAPIPDPQKEWRIITGPPVTLLSRNIMGPELGEQLAANTYLLYSDDLNDTMPPEDYPGTIGSLMQRFDVQDLEKGEYVLWVDFFVIPFFFDLFASEDYEVTPRVLAEIKKFTQVTDYPLQLKIADRTVPNYLKQNPMKKLK